VTRSYLRVFVQFPVEVLLDHLDLNTSPKPLKASFSADRFEPGQWGMSNWLLPLGLVNTSTETTPVLLHRHNISIQPYR
jgi:hypothetical protein